MICKKCGQENKSDSIFCMKCGSNLKEMANCNTQEKTKKPEKAVNRNWINIYSKWLTIETVILVIMSIIWVILFIGTINSDELDRYFSPLIGFLVLLLLWFGAIIGRKIRISIANNLAITTDNITKLSKELLKIREQQMKETQYEDC